MNFDKIFLSLESRNQGETEYLQSVREVLESIEDIVIQNPQFEANGIIERLVEPDRVLIFKVPWVNDHGKVQVNRGFRVQFNNALGPYKGGLRFHPNVNLSILKFLGFEQVFKNSLTSLPMGGAKGGADFDPKGKSNGEIMRFCQAFMLELWRLIGPDIDVPAGDIGVGTREIGYLFGMWKKLSGEHSGVITGKGVNWGGSMIRPEATGYGVVYFATEMLNVNKESIAGKKIAISGFGNVAWGAAKKARELGGIVITISGPDGYVLVPDGLSDDQIEYMLELRASNLDIVRPFTYEFPTALYFQNRKPWEVPCDIAIPCAIQNELNHNDAKLLISNGCKYVLEGANMPCTTEAVEFFIENKVMFAPGKAANAGGVATSGLEMTQNAMKLVWTGSEVDQKLQHIISGIHETCQRYGNERNGYINYVKGANIAGFLKVANAMLDQGIL
jgi:glutamate dehydrogenase (NADP+)